MLAKNVREGLRVLQAYTAAGCDPWQLSGSARASCRAHVMSELLGRRVPQSQAGVNVLRAELHKLYPQDGRCHARWVEDFRVWVLDQISDPMPVRG